VESKSISLVATHTELPIREFSWSPDSKWIAWTRGSNRGTVPHCPDPAGRRHHNRSHDGWYDANNPQFSDDGKWLTFASARDFNPIYSDTEWNHAYQNMERIYLLALAKDTPSPFAPKSDEVNLGKEADPESTAKPKEIHRRNR
jgi:tricorn protease